jgi:hypothetical protein
MCPHTSIDVSAYYFMCPHTAVYVFIPLYVSSYYHMCVLICSSYYYTRDLVRRPLILLYTYPHSPSGAIHVLTQDPYPKVLSY